MSTGVFAPAAGVAASARGAARRVAQLKNTCKNRTSVGTASTGRAAASSSAASCPSATCWSVGASTAALSPTRASTSSAPWLAPRRSDRRRDNGPSR